MWDKAADISIGNLTRLEQGSEPMLSAVIKLADFFGVSITQMISDNPNFNFRFVSDWYDYQKKEILSLDLSPYYDKPIYTELSSVKEVIPYTEKISVYKNAKISLYGNRIVAEENGEASEYLFDEVSSLAVLGKNKLNIYVGKRIFQLKSDKRFNALKYVNIFYRYQQIKKGDNNGEFLGL